MPTDQVLLDAIVKKYLSSHDFNGLPVGAIKQTYGMTTEEVKSATERLLTSAQIDVMFGNLHSNPHIRAYSSNPACIQLEFLEKLEFNDHVCLYPSQSILASLPEAAAFKDAPYTYELARGVGQLEFRAFDLSVLEHYRNDPRYLYQTNDISGYISIRDEFFEKDGMPDHDQILLETFGFAYDTQLNRAVSVFVRYLSNLSPEHQRIWHAKEVHGDYRLHPEYYRSAILGQWTRGISIFEAITQEMDLLNQMADLMGMPALFHQSFLKDRPKGFGFLLRPTLAEFNTFIHLFDKMLSDNINREFFEGQILLESDHERPDGKIVVTKKGTLTLLEEWLLEYYTSDKTAVRKALKSFRTIRSLRQKPAHTINDDVFNLEYFKLQRQHLIDVYATLRNLREVFTQHPRVMGSIPSISNALENGDIWDY